jgi:hypothetical protein
VKRWKVQAFLLDGPLDYSPYQPFAYKSAYFTWKRQAKRQIRELERSFAPGAVQIVMERWSASIERTRP